MDLTKPIPLSITNANGVKIAFQTKEALSDALARMCEDNKVPVARVFDMYRTAARNGEDYTKLMTPVDTDTHNGTWPHGFAYAALWPSFEEGIVRRLIVVKETMDRALFTLLDRPDR